MRFESCQIINKKLCFHLPYRIIVNAKLKQSSQRAYVGEEQEKQFQKAYLGEIEPVPALFEQIENNAPSRTKSWLKVTRFFMEFQENSGSGVCR